MHLFAVKLKFLNAHYSYGPAQVVYVNLVSGLELKKCELNMNMLIRKIGEVALVQGLSSNKLFSNNQCLTCFIRSVCSMVVL